MEGFQDCKQMDHKEESWSLPFNGVICGHLHEGHHVLWLLLLGLYRLEVLSLCQGNTCDWREV